jgi:hypothetical protein
MILTRSPERKLVARDVEGLKELVDIECRLKGIVHR